MSETESPFLDDLDKRIALMWVEVGKSIGRTVELIMVLQEAEKIAADLHAKFREKADEKQKES